MAVCATSNDHSSPPSECRVVAFTRKPPSPASYHFVSPTKRLKSETASDSRNALMVLPDHAMNSALEDLQRRLGELENRMDNLHLWRAKIRARELVSAYHKKHQNKEKQKTVLNALRIAYAGLRRTVSHPQISSVTALFNPQDLKEEARRLVDTLAWLENPSKCARPVLCNGKKEVQSLLAPMMMKILKDVLEKNGVEKDYVEAVTIFHKDVNIDVHSVGVDEEEVRKLGNRFINTLL